MTTALDQLAANTIRALSMDGVQKANSGHPGAPMGMADLAVVLWTQFLKVDPDAPEWEDRDRFVLSNGHGSMLLYSLLHLTGFPLPIEQLQSFRQWGSLTAGHPEYEPHIGIETTTGPLGQGFGTGVGMAIAEAHLQSVFGPGLVDHRTWAFVSDGDLMEGVSYESASLAGHLGLGKLTYVYDDNEISIDGSTDITFTEDVAGRFAAAGWHTVTIDGHDHGAIAEALEEATTVVDQPSLMIAHTVIGKGAPTKAGSAKTHGAPLGHDEIAAWRLSVDWPDVDFYVPNEVRDFFTASMERGRAAHAAWEQQKAAAFEADPQLATRWSSYFDPKPVSLENPGFEVGTSLATRAAMGQLFDQIAEKVPGFIGGAADLVESTKTEISFSPSFSRAERRGRNVHFGIREHAMGTITNGIALHGGLRPYGATFFMFSDYMRPAVRLSALMGIPTIWVYTHESLFLGEDGPTHQPVEHLASLRAMPGMTVIRPADAGEMLEAWEVALNLDGPVAVLGTRQGLPVLDRSDATGSVADGAYILRDGSDAVLVATGSEVSLALDVAEAMANDVSLRVVSMPSWELFLARDEGYRDSVLGTNIPRASIEAGATLGWERIVGRDGLTLGIDRFGASAPAGRIAEELGFTVDAVAAKVREWLR